MKPKAIICDIDGTLANNTHRQHFINPKFHPEYRLYEEFKRGELVYWEWIHKENDKPFKKDWKSFNAAMDKDTPNEWCVDILDRYWGHGHKEFTFILYVSGREEKYEELTLEWLRKYDIPGGYTPSRMFFRPDKDYRPDTVIKKEIYDNHIKDKYDILFCLDDRPSVCRMWRELGLVCLQVDDKEF